MGYIHTVNIAGDQSYLIEPKLYAVASGTANEITATITGFELIAGVTISLRMSTSNASSATLRINNGEAKPIYYQNTAVVSNILKQNYIYNLVYDGTIWHVIGETTENIQLAHKLTFGANGAYTYDGSVDVNVPVYDGTFI